MFRRNPDAVALVLISCFLLAPMLRHRQAAPLGIPRQDVKIRLLRTVASLKQCLPFRSPRRPTQRPL